MIGDSVTVPDVGKTGSTKSDITMEHGAGDRALAPALRRNGGTDNDMGSTLSAGKAIRATGFAMLSIMALLSVILVAEQYSASRSKAAVEAHRAAHVVATQTGWMFEASANTLRRMEEALPRGPGARTGDMALRDLQKAVEDLPPDMHYAIYDAAGRLTHASPQVQPDDTGADRNFFGPLRDGRELLVSPMVREGALGTPVFTMARRLDDGARFAGVAVIEIPVSRLQALAESLGFAPLSTVGLVGLDGMMIARVPPVTPKDLSGWVLFDRLAEAPDGHYETASPADGVERIVGYWKMERWPVVAIAGIDRTGALASFWRNLSLSAIIALPMLFGLGWLFWDMTLLVRQDEVRQRELAAANERSSYLLREIHHRVKNNLQTVISLIRLEQLPAEVKTRLLGRIGAMVSVHEAMYRSDQFEEICIRPYLERLVGDVAKGFGLPVTIRFDIAEVRLAGARAMLLGLLANELVSNAFKHAFATRRGGFLEVSVTWQGEGWLRLRVADDGPGFEQADSQPDGAKAMPAGGHMGSRLIDAFAQQLGGSVRIESAGRTVVIFDFPRDYGPADQPPPTGQDRPIQPVSVAGERSRKSILPSRWARSRSRT